MIEVGTSGRVVVDVIEGVVVLGGAIGRGVVWRGDDGVGGGRFSDSKRGLRWY